MIATPALLFGGLVIDAAFGEPRIIYKYLSHPVTWMGAVLSRLEKWGNIQEYSPTKGRISGALCLMIYMSFFTVIAYFIELYIFPFLLVILVSVFLSSRSLIDHVLAVRGDAPRSAVAKIVGRRVEELDDHAIHRAAIESLAENFSDGVIAPCFWFLVGGFPALVWYKAVNTADSMIGHKTPRYLYFGWAAARLDDVANYIPARITAILITLGALLHPRGQGVAAVKAAFKYAGFHKSPNAGWPESAMAGALSLRLGGPRQYGDLSVEGAWLGAGDKKASKDDILHAVQVIIICIGILLFILGGISYETWW